jgi:DNA polymerase IV
LSAWLCRDCGERGQDGGGERCAACASPRLVRHPELFSLTIAHLDCDAFYAAVEKRDDPTLMDKPVIIGGGRRGVVSTACYVARLYGIHSAMPMFQALQRCPDAVVLRPDMGKYQTVSREIRTLMAEVTPHLQPISIDEAFLDLSETEGPAAVRLDELANRIEHEVGITVSIGLSHNKFLAKLASDLDKPRGFSVLGRDDARAFLAPLPVRRIWGVGPALARRLQRDGINRISQLQDRDETELVRRYGSIGHRLAQFAVGQDNRPVEPRGEAKSLSAETTFESNVATLDELAPVLERLSIRVAERLERAERAGQTVVLKLKTADFKLRTRSATLATPTRRATVIADAGQTLLAREIDGTRFRLLGIGVANLADAGDADPPDMLENISR